MVSFTSLLALLCMHALSYSALTVMANDGRCRVVRKGYRSMDKEKWADLINSKFLAVPPKYPSATLSWQADSVEGMDDVRLVIMKELTNAEEKWYNINPRSDNRNSANVADKVIIVRMSYKLTSRAQGRHSQYYAADDLYACNVLTVPGDDIDYASIAWDYVVKPAPPPSGL